MYTPNSCWSPSDIQHSISRGVMRFDNRRRPIVEDEHGEEGSWNGKSPASNANATIGLRRHTDQANSHTAALKLHSRATRTEIMTRDGVVVS